MGFAGFDSAGTPDKYTNDEVKPIAQPVVAVCSDNSFIKEFQLANFTTRRGDIQVYCNRLYVSSADIPVKA